MRRVYRRGNPTLHMHLIIISGRASNVDAGHWKNGWYLRLFPAFWGRGAYPSRSQSSLGLLCKNAGAVGWKDSREAITSPHRERERETNPSAACCCAPEPLVDPHVPGSRPRKHQASGDYCCWLQIWTSTSRWNSRRGGGVPAEPL